MVLSERFQAAYLDCIDRITGSALGDAEASDALDEMAAEVTRLCTAFSAGRLSEAGLALARQQIRFLAKVLLRQPLAAETKDSIRRFAAEELADRLLAGADGLYTQDWFYYHEAHWLEIFGQLAGRPGLRFLELGCFEGRATCWMLSHLLTGADSSIICVDLFQAHENQERYFGRNISAIGGRAKVIKLRGRSQLVLQLLDPRSFDFIYIDASHYGLDVLQDACAAWNLLKPGGYMVFDDYATVFPGDRLGISCRDAVDAFLGLVKGRHSLLFQDWQLAIRKS